ncbi:MAG: ATP-binding cassette domain-containing protein [Oligoflexales bacterium]|nr:ATP-binding cassette domain-containing protein [Oligoflexales bacterium]
MSEGGSPLIRVQGLKKYFPLKRFFWQPKQFLQAVDGVSFDIHKGEIYGLVGESGCGKSTLGRAILQLNKPSAGRVFFKETDVTALNKSELMPFRQYMQIIFQDPYSSLNPRMTVLQIIREPLDTHKVGTPADRLRKVETLVELVGLSKQILSRYPHEFSGGQRQRIGIARALTLNPQFIVADEPVSALDVSVQAQVLNLISDLRQQFGISFLFIAHDLAVVQHISHRVGVMYMGKIVEEASSEEIYLRPKHPYTQALLAAIPKIGSGHIRERKVLTGEVSSPINPPSGCNFHPRCPHAMDICKRQEPQRINAGSKKKPHFVKCHLK